MHNTSLYVSLLNIGPPKHAANAICWYPCRANAIFENASPMLLPQAKIDNPTNESDMSEIIPTAVMTLTTSFATL